MPLRARGLASVALGPLCLLLAGCATSRAGPEFPPAPNFPPDHRYTLDDLIELSVHRNLGLQAARYEGELAASLTDQVKALWLPAIRYDFAALAYSNDLNYKARALDLATINIPLTGSYNLVNSANYAQILTTFGKRTSGLKQARMVAEMARLQVLVCQDTLACEIANLYYVVCLSNDIDTVLDDTLRRLKVFQQVAGQLNARGSLRASKLDSLEADLLVNQLEQLRVLSQAARQAAYVALKRAVGLNRDEPLVLRDVALPSAITPGEAVSVSAAVVQGFLGRPETKQADLFAQLGKEQVNFAKRLLLPNVAVLSTYSDTQGSHHPILNAVDGLVASVIIDVPIYDPAARARVRTALFAEKASEALRQCLEQLLVLEIEVTALDAQRSLKTLLQTNRAQLLAEEHERSARQAYTSELVPAPTVILAIGVTAFTRVQHLTAVFAYHSARARLNRVTGNREVRYGP